jgi:hypothetical protein
MDVIRPVAMEHFYRALGEAVVRIWGRLPADIQHDLFEFAVASDNEAMRPQLAAFLHEKHPRTLASTAGRAILEPDSLGG